MLERLLTTPDCVDIAFVNAATLDQLLLPSMLGKTRVGGVDLNKVRVRTVLAGVMALASSPTGFRVSDLAAKITNMSTHMERAYRRRQA